MTWRRVNRAHPVACELSDRHYPRRARRARKAKQFVAPGRYLAFLTDDDRALWVVTDQEFVEHAWPGAWNVACFRNEGPRLSSELIAEGLAATLQAWGGKPRNGILTFVTPSEIRSPNPGYCFKRAGWVVIGSTPGGHGRAPKVGPS